MEILVLTNDEDKKCARCHRTRPLYCYHRRGESYQPYCIECSREYKKLNGARNALKKAGILDTPLADISKKICDMDKTTRKVVRKSLADIINIIDKQKKITR